jgi:hypothetical protein
MDAVREHTDCMYLLDPQPKEPPKDGAVIQSWCEGDLIHTQITLPSPGRTFTARYRRQESVNTTWTLEHLLKDISDIADYLRIPYATPDPDMEAYLKVQQNLGDRGVMLLSLSDPICEAATLFGMDRFLVYAITKTGEIKAFLDAIHERQMAYLRKILAYDVHDIVFRIYGPEYATPPYLPPSLFTEFVTGYLRQSCTLIRQAGGLPRIHCHGKIARILDDLAGTDAVALDPVEPPPDGDISLAELKRRWGRRFCLMGGLELRDLELSNPGHIDTLVKEAMQSAKEGSGFVLMPSACPLGAELSDRTRENYLQMIESALRYGQY